MKIAIIGSRTIIINNLDVYLPNGATEIVSGGAKGIDTCAKEYALKNKIKFTEFLPDYKRFGRCAPLKRNIQIIEYADLIIAFWDGKSKGTSFVIDEAKKRNKTVKIYLV